MSVGRWKSCLLFIFLGIWWYPDAKSSVVKYLAFSNWSKISVIFGSENESPIVRSFSFRKSTTTRSIGFPNASAILSITRSNGAFHWLTLVRIILSLNISCVCRFTSVLCFSERRYGLTFTGAVSARVFILGHGRCIC